MNVNSLRSSGWAAFGLATMLVAAATVDLAWAQKPAQSNTGKPRIEKDLVGEKQVPSDVSYGVQAAPALEPFQISGVAINHYPGFVEAWAMVKLTAAQANTDVAVWSRKG